VTVIGADDSVAEAVPAVATPPAARILVIATLMKPCLMTALYIMLVPFSRISELN
jgi:uncharacterized protein with ACT and thioredoxin-like domain